jgi:hypothetical protein
LTSQWEDREYFLRARRGDDVAEEMMEEMEEEEGLQEGVMKAPKDFPIVSVEEICEIEDPLPIFLLSLLLFCFMTLTSGPLL